jgi:hypothetical protein
MAEGVQAMCIERAEGRANLSYSSMAEILREELGVEIRTGTMLNHVRHCLPALHRQIQDRGRQP